MPSGVHPIGSLSLALYCSPMHPARRHRWSTVSAGAVALGGAATVLLSLNGPSVSPPAIHTQLKVANFIPDTTVLQPIPSGSEATVASALMSPPANSSAVTQDAWNGHTGVRWTFAAMDGTLHIAPWGGAWWSTHERNASTPTVRLPFDLPGFDTRAPHWHDGQRWGVITRPEGGLWVVASSGQDHDAVRLHQLDRPPHLAGTVTNLTALPSGVQVHGRTPEGQRWDYRVEWRRQGTPIIRF